MKKNYLLWGSLLMVFLIAPSTFRGQQTKTINGAIELKVAHKDLSPPIRDIKVFTDRLSTYEAKEIKNKFDFKNRTEGNTVDLKEDPVLQNTYSANRVLPPSVDRIYEGVSNATNQSVRGGRITPPDTQGDVGPNHYVQMTNLLTMIFDLNTDAVIFGPEPNSIFWAGFVYNGIDFGASNDGDPIVLYDQFEDRWIVSQFETTHDYVLIAVSQTSDPTGAYYRYAISYPAFPDYPKFGIWNDAIYITTRDFNYGFQGSTVTGIEKAGLYNGTTANAFMIPILDADYNFDGIVPADADGSIPPPPGTPHYSIFKPYGSYDYIYMATTTPDWGNPSNSSMTISPITVAAYISDNSLIYQPNNRGLHAHAWAMMYRLQYRNFGTHQSMVANHTVKASTQRGIRWYEFRANTGSTSWTTYQQGTYSPADGDNRWMGSIAMNGNGDIALGYSVTGSSTHPSIRFTGQSAYNSGTGLMDLPETSIHEGTASIDGAYNRWGDYSMMSVDPVDDIKFWYTTEYGLGDVQWADWATKIAEINLNAPAGLANIAVSPASLSFNSIYGISGAEMVNVINTSDIGSFELNWTAEVSPAVTWLSITPLSGSLTPGSNEDISVSYDATSLTIGTYNTNIVISSNADNTPVVTVPVTLELPNSAPEAICQDIIVSADANCEAIVTAIEVDNGSIDPNGDVLTYTLSPEGPYSVGVHNVTLTVTDPYGEFDVCSAIITVEDNNAPIITVAGPLTIWPPNHQYAYFDVDDLVISVSDDCSSVSMDDLIIVSASSDEAENADNDGNTFNDIVIAGDCKSIQLRKERNSNSNGRVYKVTVEVDDGSGNTGTAICEVHVPLSKKLSAIADGEEYEVYGNCGSKSSSITGLDPDLGNQIKNYPNPFNNKTTINFTLSQDAKVVLKVFNSIGNEVAELYNGSVVAGTTYNVVFDGNDFPKGVYYYHLSSDKGVNLSNKMILIK